MVDADCSGLKVLVKDEKETERGFDIGWVKGRMRNQDGQDGDVKERYLGWPHCM